jgi:hypothetical protein
MTTWTISGRQSLLSILGRRLKASRLVTVAVARLIFRFLLVVAGLGLLSAAAWTVAVPLGLAAAGVSCLVLEWAVKR